ncbi:hypothetical protein TNCV_2007701 [Trichonephila clavipes]|nr:hypothetical protein TNCV_2007701 [Trichonephila clavipes]
MYVQPQLWQTKTFWRLPQSSKDVIEADSDGENEMNSAASVPTLSEMRNIMKGMSNYLDAHSSGEMNNKVDDIENFDSKKDNTKRNNR